MRHIRDKIMDTQTKSLNNACYSSRKPLSSNTTKLRGNPDQRRQICAVSLRPHLSRRRYKQRLSSEIACDRRRCTGNISGQSLYNIRDPFCQVEKQRLRDAYGSNPSVFPGPRPTRHQMRYSASAP